MTIFDIKENDKFTFVLIKDKLKDGPVANISYTFPKKDYRGHLNQLIDITINGIASFPKEKKNIKLYKYINGLNKKNVIVTFFIDEKYNEISVSISPPYNNIDFDNDYLISITGKLLAHAETEYSNIMNIIWS